MGEDDSFMDKKKPHKAKHSGNIEISSKILFNNF